MRRRLTKMDELQEELDAENRKIKLMNKEIQYFREKLLDKELF